MKNYWLELNENKLFESIFVNCTFTIPDMEEMSELLSQTDTTSIGDGFVEIIFTATT